MTDNHKLEPPHEEPEVFDEETEWEEMCNREQAAYVRQQERKADR